MGKSERKEPIQSESIRIRFSEKQKKKAPGREEPDGQECIGYCKTGS